MEIRPTASRFEAVVIRVSTFFEHLGAFTHDQKAVVITLSIFFIAVFVFFAGKVRFDTSFESYFNKNDPHYAKYLQFREDFGSDEIAYILYEAPEKALGAWDIEVMKKVAHLTRELEEEVPFVKKVTSLANAEFIEGKNDELLIHEVLEPFPRTQKELLVIRDRVMKKPMLVGTVVSADGQHGAFLIEMEKSSVDPGEELILDPAKGMTQDNLYPQVTNDAIERILARPMYAGIRFYHTGDAALGAVYNRITRGESIRLGTLSALLIGGLLLFFFRRPLGVLGPLGVVLIAILVATGFVGFMGWELDIMYTMLPGTIITVGVASAVHILTEYTSNHKRLKDKRTAVRKTMLMLGAPCLFTMLTDVAGFGSTNVSSIKALQHFAVYSSIGVVVAFLLTVTLFLSVLTIFGTPSSSRRKSADRPSQAGDPPSKKHFSIRWFAALARFDARHPWGITIGWMAFFALVSSGMVFLTVDSNFITQFSEELPVRRATEYVDRVMVGAGGFSYLFDSGEPDGISDPEFLKRVERIQNRINEETDLVMKTVSIVDLIKDINQAFHNEDPAYHVLPGDRNLIAQYLLLYEMAGGEEIGNYIAGDWRRVNLEVHCKLRPSSVYRKVTENVDSFIENHCKPSERPVLTGSGFLWIKLVDYIVDSQIMGFSVAFCVITVMMCVVMGSIRIGLLAMVPNLAPVLVTLGFMGWTGISLDYVKLLVASIAIGIAVDDTIHFILRYRLEFWRTRNYRQALESSLNDVGRSIFITTVALLVGFAVNLFSILDSVVEFGFLTLITLAVAALADYFLTPALIIIFRAFGPEQEMAGEAGVPQNTV